MSDDIIEGMIEEDFGTFKLIKVCLDRRESNPIEPSEQRSSSTSSKDWPEFNRPSTFSDQFITAEEWRVNTVNPTIRAFEFEWGCEFEEDGEIGILPVTFSSIPDERFNKHS